MQDVNWIALIVFVVLFGFITWLGFAAALLAQGRSRPVARMGPRRAAVPARSSPGSSSVVIFTRPTPSSPFQRSPSAPAQSPFSQSPTPSSSTRSCSWYSRASGMCAISTITSPRPTLCAGATATDGSRAGDHDHRYHRHHAVYRLAAGRVGSRDRRAGRWRGRWPRRRSATDHRVHHSCRLHLFERTARAGLDRNRQGYPDLHHRVRGGDRHPDPAGRFRQDLRRHSGAKAATGASRRQHDRRLHGICTRRWRSDRRSRCFSTRIPSPGS